MHTADIKFVATLENFTAEVVEASAQTPVLVDFWAPWCGPCRSLMPLLDRIADDYGGRFRLAKLNTDEQQDIAGHFGIRSIPTVLLFKDGKVVDQFVGVQPESAIRSLLDRHVPAAGAETASAGDAAAETAAETVPPPVQDPLEQAVELANRHLAGHDPTAARVAIADAVAREPGHRALKIIQARIAFVEIVAAHPDHLALRARLEQDPADSAARHALAAHHAAAGDFATALSEWLELLRRDRRFGEDAARRSLLQVFDVLGDKDETAQQYRKKMASLLN